MVRTRQLDDTVSPVESVQLAINGNFDQVGAFQTRLGVDYYADDLDGEVRNFGTLRNTYTPDGYDNFFAIGDEEQINGTMNAVATAKYDDSHVLVMYTNSSVLGGAVIVETSLDDGGSTPIGTPLSFGATQVLMSKIIQIDATHFLAIWSGASDDGFAQVLAVNAGTYAVTALGSAFEFDTANGQNFSVSQIDSSHFIVFYTGTGNDGIATVLAVNLGTWAVTQPGSPLTFEAGSTSDNSCASLGNGTHFINFWTNKVQVFSVNTSTWAITALASPLTYNLGVTAVNPSTVAVGDGQHFMTFWYGFSGEGIARVFAVNPSTFAVTAPATTATYQSGTTVENSSAKLDSTHFVNFWVDGSNVGHGQIFEMNPSTFVITPLGTPVSLGTTGGVQRVSVIAMNAFRVFVTFVNFPPGYGQMFKLQGNPVNGKFLYAQVGDEVYNTEDTTWTVRRSGLNPDGKARFCQYLNYIWMVNGNEQLEGDPVATSNGGDFGSDLVPDDLPPGDFIQGGFEGRIWIVNRSLGVVYYTDIVQFTPPDIYTIGYDPEVNFISNLNPQTGETFTALVDVPRALLLFTENSIFRIYGATSVDNYPAYNVGTYSQESIVKTKTGIFFHHSSGFYQFDYGSQPVEISRRIIDYVRAIPRAQYDDIVGVYDGYDNIEWAVGPLTVDGIAYADCVLRYTISTQVWTTYDYSGNIVTAMIQYDDGTSLNYLMGTSLGRVGVMGTGFDDFGNEITWEFVDRWRSFTEMYCETTALQGINVYSENAAGANLSYQPQGSTTNEWIPIGTVDQNNNSLFPNAETQDFQVMRFRMAGVNRGNPVIIHGIEVLNITVKGYDEN